MTCSGYARDSEIDTVVGAEKSDGAIKLPLPLGVSLTVLIPYCAAFMERSSPAKINHKKYV